MGCKSVLFFYGCLKLRFPDVEVNPGPKSAPQCCRVMFTNINGLHGNRDELAIAASKFDVVACAETKVTGRRHVSELLLPGFKAPTLLLKGDREMGLVWRCLFALVFLFRGRKGSSVLVVCSWLPRFQNFSQSLSFTRLTARCFFLFFNYFSFIFPFPRT